MSNVKQENKGRPAFLHKPFGPRILQTVLSKELVDDFNKTIDEIVADETQAKELDWSDHLVGKVHQELTLPPDLIRRYADEFDAIFNAYGNAMQKEGLLVNNNEHLQIAGFNVISNWVVRSFAGDYNPVHMHQGSTLVCVGYLKIPDWEEEILKDQEDHHPANGQIDFQYGEAAPLARFSMRHLPEVGDFFVFPSWLKHTVYPFRSSGERRSFSFNVSIDLEDKS